MIFLKPLLLLFLSVFSFIQPVLATTINIALISDGEGAREIIPEERLTKEIRELLEPQYQVRFTSRNGGWTENGVSKVLLNALEDPAIDAIITQGLVSTHIAGKLPNLSKPVVGMFVPEPDLQKLPLTENKTSGKDNYTYISDLQNFDESMSDVVNILPKKKIGLIVDQIIIDGIPMLANQSFYGDADVHLISVNSSLDELVTRLPEDLGSVMLGPLSRFSKTDIAKLAEIFISRGLPSVSFTSDAGVEDGILMAIGTETVEVQKSARRIALNLLNIFEGKNAGDLPVVVRFGSSLKYNQKTAESIGFELPWDISLTAKLYGSPEASNSQPGMDLNDAVNKALDNNLLLAQQRLTQDIAAEDVRIARSTWWPQLSLSAQGSKINSRSTAIGNPEQEISSGIRLDQLVYSEGAKANVDIAKLSQEESRYQLDTIVLDTIQSVSTAYISVLRTKALEEVQRANLTASLENLELSENRFELGAVTEADVLRWKSQIATDKRNLLSAQSSVDSAIINFKNIIRMPPSETINFDKSDTQRLIELSLNREVRAIFDSPSERMLMTQFIVDKAIENAPELKQAQINADISSRSIQAAKSAFYSPTVNLSAQQNYSLERSGRFSDETNNAFGDDNWRVDLSLSYPFFQGGKLKAELSKIRLQQEQTLLNIDLTRNNIRANTLNQWNSIGASYPGIFLSQEAADAANRTLALTRDQYANGAINLTTLIEAQNTALAAELNAAEAQYVYLIDFVNIGRAVSDFRSIMNESQGNAWLQEFKQYKLESKNQ